MPGERTSAPAAGDGPGDRDDGGDGATLVHGTCLRIGRAGVLLLGPPGSGKSSLALRLLDRPGRGTGDAPLAACLVADDQVRLRRRGDRLHASPPPALAGLLEVRGLGIVPVARHCASVTLDLIVRLAEAADIPRLPERTQSMELLGLSLPLLRLDPADVAAPARLRAALRHLALA